MTYENLVRILGHEAVSEFETAIDSVFIASQIDDENGVGLEAVLELLTTSLATIIALPSERCAASGRTEAVCCRLKALVAAMSHFEHPVQSLHFGDVRN